MTPTQFRKFLRALFATLATGLTVWALTKLGVNITVPSPIKP